MGSVAGSSSEDVNVNYGVDAAARGAQLLAAASEGRGDEAVRILESDPDLLRVGDPVGDTAMHVLARAGHLDALRQLIGFLQSQPGCRELLSTVAKQGNGHGDTPLHLASKNRHREAVILLYKAEWRAIFVKNDDDKCLRDLIDEFESDDEEDDTEEMTSEDEEVPYSIDEDKQDNWYDKILAARYTGHAGRLSALADVELNLVWAKLTDQIVEMLGSDPKLIQAKSKETGNSIFQDAACSGNMDILTKLVGLAPGKSLLLDRNDCGDTALHLALNRKLTKEARYLMELAPEAAYQVNNNGESPLYMAIKHGDHELINYMLQLMPLSAISPDSKHALFNAKKGSLPHAAIRARNLTMLKVILESLPSLIDSPDEKGWKPLSYASYKGYHDEVKYLLKKFPESVKNFDDDGCLPIHKVVSGGHISIIQEFISCHPQTLYDVDKKGRNILHIAVRYSKIDILVYLTQKIHGVEKIFDLRDHDDKTFEDLAKELKRNKNISYN